MKRQADEAKFSIYTGLLQGVEKLFWLSRSNWKKDTFVDVMIEFKNQNVRTLLELILHEVNIQF